MSRNRRSRGWAILAGAMILLAGAAASTVSSTSGTSGSFSDATQVPFEIHTTGTDQPDPLHRTARRPGGWTPADGRSTARPGQSPSGGSADGSGSWPGGPGQQPGQPGAPASPGDPGSPGSPGSPADPGNPGNPGSPNDPPPGGGSGNKPPSGAGASVSGSVGSGGISACVGVSAGAKVSICAGGG